MAAVGQLKDFDAALVTVSLWVGGEQVGSVGPGACLVGPARRRRPVPSGSTVSRYLGPRRLPGRYLGDHNERLMWAAVAIRFPRSRPYDGRPLPPLIMCRP